jgi:hypothetical protein
MNKIAALILLVCISFAASSCVSVKQPLSGSDITVKLAPKDYEILGEVVYEGSIKRVLLFFSWGDATYYELNKLAKEKYGADDVINISEDTTLTMYYVFFIKRGYIMRGLAIKYN